MADQFTLVLQVKGTEELAKLEGVIKGVGTASQTTEKSLKDAAAQTKAIKGGFDQLAKQFKSSFDQLSQSVTTLSQRIESLNGAATKRTTGKTVAKQLTEDAKEAEAALSKTELGARKLRAIAQEKYDSSLVGVNAKTGSGRSSIRAEDLRTQKMQGVVLTPQDATALRRYEDNLKAISLYGTDLEKQQQRIQNEGKAHAQAIIENAAREKTAQDLIQREGRTHVQALAQNAALEKAAQDKAQREGRTHVQALAEDTRLQKEAQDQAQKAGRTHAQALAEDARLQKSAQDQIQKDGRTHAQALAEDVRLQRLAQNEAQREGRTHVQALAEDAARQKKVQDEVQALGRMQARAQDENASRAKKAADDVQREGRTQSEALRANQKYDADALEARRQFALNWQKQEDALDAARKKVLDAEARFSRRGRTQGATDIKQFQIVEGVKQYIAASRPLEEIRQKFGDTALRIAGNTEEYQKLATAAAAALSNTEGKTKSAVRETERLADAAGKAAVAFSRLNDAQKLERAEKARDFLAKGDTTYRGAVRAYGADAVSLGLNPQKLQELQKAVEEAKKAKDELGGTAQRTRRTIMDHGDSVMHAATAYNVLHTSLRGAAGSMGAIWLTWGKPLAALWAGFAAVGAVRESVKTFAEFEYQLRIIQAVAGETGEAVAKVGEAALKASRGGLYSATELVQGTKTLALAGLSVPEANSQIGAVSRFATAGEMKIPDAAQSLVGIASAFGRSSSDLSLVGDTIAKGAAISQTSIENMTSAIRVSSVVAEQYGASLQDVSGILAQLAARNIEATTAGTALRNAYNEVYAPTDKAAKVMQQLGLRAYEAGSGKMKPFIQVMEELREKIKDLDKESQNRVFATLFGERGGKVASALLSDLEGAKNKIKEVGDSFGYTSQASLLIENSIKGRAIGAVNSLKAAFDEAGKASEGSLSVIVGQLSRIADSQALQDVLTRLVNVFASLAKSVLDSIDSLALLTGLYFGGKGVSLVAGFAGSIQSLVQQFGAMNLVFRTTNMLQDGYKLSMQNIVAAASGTLEATGKMTAATTAATAAKTAGTAAAGGLATALTGIGRAATGAIAIAGPLVSGFAALVSILWAASTAWDAYKKKQDDALRGLEEANMDFDKRLQKRIDEGKAKFELNQKTFFEGKAKPADLEVAFAERTAREQQVLEERIRQINEDQYLSANAKKNLVAQEKRLTEQTLQQIRAQVDLALAYDRSNASYADAFETRAKLAQGMQTGDKVLPPEPKGSSYSNPLGTEQKAVREWYDDQIREIGKQEDRKLQVLNVKRRANLISEEEFDKQSEEILERRLERQLRLAYEYQDKALPQMERDRNAQIMKLHGADPEQFAAQMKASREQFRTARADAARTITDAQAAVDNFYEDLGINREGQARKMEEDFQNVLNGATKRDVEREAAFATDVANIRDSLGFGAELQALKDNLSGLSAVELEYQANRIKVEKAYAAKINEARDLNREDRVEKLRAEEQEQLELIKQASIAKEQARRDPMVGLRSASQSILDEANDLAKLSGDALTNAFKGAEESFIKFVTTGKSGFRDFANSVLADMARIALKQMVVAPFTNFLQGLMGGTPTIDSTVATALVPGPNGGLFPGMHAGGMVGTAGAMRRADPAWFAGARRYHEGGPVLASDEVPIIARKGERVLTPEQNRSYEGGAGNAVNITQNINVGGGVSRGEVITAMQAAKEAAKGEILESMRRGGRYS